ncbi:hypothetical protein EK21DRAFT_71224 [Setomelanomma holmii]|uniref:F-box domain-containing protein n=1 Tax=Setomelanomma holmii TaxID=210430 RepID=A0A9P4LK09_9PLEO|nr:hypothetical protein EK21DRAFT_71224 [Setomelanomma holmii]
MRDADESDEDDGGEWVEGGDEEEQVEGDDDGVDDDEEDVEEEGEEEDYDDDNDPWNSHEAAWNMHGPDYSHHADDNEDEDADSSDGDDDRWSQASVLSLQDDFDHMQDNKDETSSMFSYHEQHSYDPEKLKKEDFEWADRARVLGINPEWEEEKKKAFINPGACEQPVYHAYEPNEPGQEQRIATFPFHEECYKLLARRLGYDHRKYIDKDVLYEVMKQNVVELAKNLEFNYGSIEGVEQFWECYAGEEYAVTDPGPRAGIEEVVKSMLPASLFDRPETAQLSLAHKVRHDPLAVLPYDVLHGIVSHLSINDTLSLVKASWHVFDATRQPFFWRHMIRLHIASFFYELDGLLKDATFPGTFDWRGLFQWLNEITKGKYAMDTPFNGIANRRRIWNVCSQLAPLYQEKLYAESYKDPGDEEAAAIMSNAKAYHTVVTVFPQPPASETKTVSTQFIRSWSEIAYRACDLETYWNKGYKGDLVGISVCFGSATRVFGSTEGVKGLSLHVGAGEWIREIRLLLHNIEAHKNSSDEEEITGPEDKRALDKSGITGMALFLTDGRENISLLQASHPSAPIPASPPSYTPAQTLLWTSRGTHVYSYSGLTVPIWSHPTKSFYAFPPPPSSSLPTFPHTDMLPYHTINWAQIPSAYENLTQIRFLQVPDEHGLSILGIHQKTTSRFGGSEHSGTGGAVPGQIWEEWKGVKAFKELDLWNKVKTWDERFMGVFEIDGPGGEVVSEVWVTRDRRTIKLVSSLGREGVFGDEVGGTAVDGGNGEDGWDVKKAAEGELIVGLGVSFGRVGGWSPGARRWSHWGMSDVGVIVVRVEDEVEESGKQPRIGFR